MAEEVRKKPEKPEKPEKPALPPELERGVSLALAVVAALVAVTCGSRGELQGSASSPASVASNAAPAPALSSAPPNASAPPSSGVAASALPASSPPPSEPLSSDPTQLELRHFFADVKGLEQRTRKQPVRVVWFGDSHTAADYLTGEVRARLQARFGAGGPGFVRIGVKPYRHSQLHWTCDGGWRIEPSQPSRRSQFDDGSFGLGGIRAFPGDAPAFASFEVSKGTAHGQLAWRLWFNLPEGSSFRLDLAGVSQVVTPASAKEAVPNAGFSELALTSALADKLQISTLTGAPRFFGLTVEGSEPGLVLDAVGIDGARVATMLAWNEASFEAALGERAPSLVVLAFGTNEAFDADKVEKFRAQYADVLARVRKSAPDTDCWLVGPPDANAVAGGSEPRVSEIDALQRSVAKELGCGYSSQLEIMGGPGGYSHWVNKIPQLARGDRLHLTPKGYEVMADALADKLLAAYDRKKSAASLPR